MLRNSVFFFAALALSAIAGFWPTHVSRVGEETNLHVHFHGAVMFLWVAMLVTQIPPFFVPTLPAWRAIAGWYAGLPIP